MRSNRRVSGILLRLAPSNHLKRRREMKKNILALLSAMMLIGGISCAQNKEGAAKPGAVVVDAVKLTGIVKAIDREKKMVTVEGSGGRTVVIDATNARNLDQLKVGDRVNLTYVEEV